MDTGGLLALFLALIPVEIQTGNIQGFDRNFYYGPEGGVAEICLNITKYELPFTGEITILSETATQNQDYNNTVITVNITANSSGPVCYDINLLEDNEDEGLETIVVVITPSNKSDEIFRRNATVTITDDDDIDECANRTHNCNLTLASCVNTDGSFRCVTDNGYSEDGLFCQDIDECAREKDNCTMDSTCKNTLGSFQCSCNIGYTPIMGRCADIDECARGKDDCTMDSTCKNTLGSFHCSCIIGYTLIMGRCVDIDECARGKDDCTMDSTCKNTLGSFQCSCNIGYTLIMGRCVDVDECARETDNCTINSTCINTKGSFNCSCHIGYTLSLGHCAELPDSFISVLLTIKNQKFTNSLNDPTSNDYQALSTQIKNNFDEEFANYTEYRGVNIIRFRNGSVICEAELVLVPNSERIIDKVLGKINKSGILGNFSLVRGSLTTSMTLALKNISMDVRYSGHAGDMLELTCSVKGPQLPSFVWKANGMVLKLSARVKIENKNQISKLFVRKTEKNDSGLYYCIARKGVDTINSTRLINVKVVPMVRVYPLSVVRTEGHQVTLTCEIFESDGEDIEFSWYTSKQSGKIDGAKTLNISDILPLDGGSRFTAHYWCFANNSDGIGRSQNVTVFTISSDFNDFCFENMADGHTWEKSPVGALVVKNCPGASTGTLTRYCHSTASEPKWGEVNISKCRSLVVIELLDKVLRLDEGFETEDIGKILNQTVQVSRQSDLYSRDVADIVNILVKTKDKTKSQTDRENFILSSSNIVNEDKLDAWRNMKLRNILVGQIISATDLTAKEYISQTAKAEKVVSYTTNNVDVRGIRRTAAKPMDAGNLSLLSESGEGVVIPGNVTNEIKLMTVVIHNSIKYILSEEELKKSVDHTIDSHRTLTIRSTIVSFKTEPRLGGSTMKSFKIVVQNNQSGFDEPRRMCVFIEPDINSSAWSREGCTLNESQSTEENVTCDCDHNTAFAIMMDVTGVQITESEREILELISTIGCSVSIVCIALTIFIQAYFWKHLKSLRAKVLLSLCVAIGFTDIFAILEGVARDSPNFCKAVAALLHFFVLSAFGWMLCEGILLYIMLIKVYDVVRGKHWRIFNFIGWGCPLLIVVVSLGATEGDGYGTESTCWLSIENKLIWTFVAPALLIILANTIVFIMVLHAVMSSHEVKQQDNIRKVKRGVKISAAIFPVLGLTWVFGLMTFNRETLAFRYLFAVFNSAQGMLIFLFHCVLNKQMREIVRESINRGSILSTSFGKKDERRRRNSANSSSKTNGSNFEKMMAESNAGIELERSDWNSERNASVAEDAKYEGKES